MCSLSFRYQAFYPWQKGRENPTFLLSQVLFKQESWRQSLPWKNRKKLEARTGRHMCYMLPNTYSALCGDCAATRLSHPLTPMLRNPRSLWSRESKGLPQGHTGNTRQLQGANLLILGPVYSVSGMDLRRSNYLGAAGNRGLI